LIMMLRSNFIAALYCVTTFDFIPAHRKMSIHSDKN
jgi:hypothetical protein